MREGEESLVILPSGFYKPRYQGNLWVSIQLIYITQCQNPLFPQNQPFLREHKLSNGIVKRVAVEGEGETISNVSKVWLQTEGWLEDSFQFQKFKEETISFTKEGKTYGLSQILALNTMRRGEIS